MVLLYVGRVYKKTLLEPVNSEKSQDTKSTCKSQLCFYTLSDQFKKEIKETILFIVVSKKNKILWNKLRRQKTCIMRTIKYC